MVPLSVAPPRLNPFCCIGTVPCSRIPVRRGRGMVKERESLPVFPLPGAFAAALLAPRAAGGQPSCALVKADELSNCGGHPCTGSVIPDASAGCGTALPQPSRGPSASGGALSDDRGASELAGGKVAMGGKPLTGAPASADAGRPDGLQPDSFASRSAVPRLESTGDGSWTVVDSSADWPSPGQRSVSFSIVEAVSASLLAAVSWEEWSAVFGGAAADGPRFSEPPC